MKWQELGLKDEQLASLRERLGDDGADRAVQLAHGAPELLARFVGDDAVETLKTFQSASSVQVPAYKLGARFGGPSIGAVDPGHFEVLRDSLVEDFKRAESPMEKADVEAKLVALYQSSRAG